MRCFHLQECSLDLSQSLRAGRAGADRSGFALERPADLQCFQQVSDFRWSRENERDVNEIGADKSAKISAASFPHVDDSQGLPALERLAHRRAAHRQSLAQKAFAW